MDFWGSVLVLLRRWYIALPAFIVAVALAGAVYASRPINYASSSVLVLTAPTSGGVQRVEQGHTAVLINPLLNFDQGLNNTAALVIQGLNTSETHAKLKAHPNGDPTFKANNGSSNPELLINGPFINIMAQSTSPGKAEDLVLRVTQQAREELVNLQQDLKAPQSTYIVLAEAVPATSPQAQGRSSLRPAIALLAIGCIASIAAAFAAESIMTRPSRHLRTRSVAKRRTFAEVVPESGVTASREAGFSAVTAQTSADAIVVDGE